MSLFEIAIDLNPHQIEAALFAVLSTLSKAVTLADEAGIVLCQYWDELRRHLLMMCPAAIRKQCAMELSKKFRLPVAVLQVKGWREVQHMEQGSFPRRRCWPTTVRPAASPSPSPARLPISKSAECRRSSQPSAMSWPNTIRLGPSIPASSAPTQRVCRGLSWVTPNRTAGLDTV
jgi:hypothetical protein